MQTILLVDDEEFFRERLSRALRDRGFQVLAAADYAAGIEAIRSHLPPMAIIDLKMAGKSGLDLLGDGLKLNPAMRAVVLTGYGSIATAIEAVRLGALNYLAKPADVDDILQAFARDPNLDLESEPAGFAAPSLARAEWEHIQRVLADCGGNISAAAKRLDIHRRTLQRKLTKYAPK